MLEGLRSRRHDLPGSLYRRGRDLPQPLQLIRSASDPVSSVRKGAVRHGRERRVSARYHGGVDALQCAPRIAHERRKELR